MRILLFFPIVFLLSCCTQINVEHRVSEIIDSLSCTHNVVSFYKKDMADYWLYTISNQIGLVYDEEGNYNFSEIKQIGHKDYIVYSKPKEIHDIDESQFNTIVSLYNDPSHSIVWYFAITKDAKRDLLIQPANSDVMPYEIPSIRNFINPAKVSNDYEYIWDDITIETNDSLQKARIRMIVKQFNRLESKKEVTHRFSFAWLDDTLQFKIDTLALCSSVIDDTLWVDDPCLVNRFDLELELKGISTEFKERDSIRKYLLESIFVEGDKNDTEVIIPSDILIHLQHNGIWEERP